MDATYSLLARVHQTMAEDAALQSALGVATAEVAAQKAFITQASKDTQMPYLVFDIRTGASPNPVVRNDELLIDIWDYLGVTNLSRLHSIREAIAKLFHYQTLETANGAFFLQLMRGEFVEVDSTDGLVRRYEMVFSVRSRHV